MKIERKLEIRQEAIRRLNLWIVNSNIDEMTVGGSRLRFDMSLGLFEGYPFENKSWMVGFDGFINEDEFNSDDYDEIITELFNDMELISIFNKK
jgi:hypothetical protein